MHLDFDLNVANRYKSPSQKARVLTEDWAQRHLYCPACQHHAVERKRDNTKIYDFVCVRCAETFQLKSQKHPIGCKILDSAYQPMLDAIRTNKAPNFFLLHYDPLHWTVRDLLLIPRYFISSSCIEARKPLSPQARRADWVGCWINIAQVPSEGRIFLVQNRIVYPSKDVSTNYRRFAFLNKNDWQSRGWTADVLACLDKLGKPQFTLHEVYAFAGELQTLHPGNFHVRDKIRQQLQVLRDHQIVSFVGQGVYKFSQHHRVSPLDSNL